jgi:hypothetical protein
MNPSFILELIPRLFSSQPKRYLLISVASGIVAIASAFGSLFALASRGEISSSTAQLIIVVFTFGIPPIFTGISLVYFRKWWSQDSSQESRDELLTKALQDTSDREKVYLGPKDVNS